MEQIIEYIRTLESEVRTLKEENKKLFEEKQKEEKDKENEEKKITNEIEKWVAMLHDPDLATPENFHDFFNKHISKFPLKTIHKAWTKFTRHEKLIIQEMKKNPNLAHLIISEGEFLKDIADFTILETSDFVEYFCNDELFNNFLFVLKTNAYAFTKTPEFIHSLVLKSLKLKQQLKCVEYFVIQNRVSQEDILALFKANIRYTYEHYFDLDLAKKLVECWNSDFISLISPIRADTIESRQFYEYIFYHHPEIFTSFSCLLLKYAIIVATKMPDKKKEVFRLIPYTDQIQFCILCDFDIRNCVADWQEKKNNMDAEINALANL